LAALRSSASSIFSVVLMCMNMHPESIHVKRLIRCRHEYWETRPSDFIRQYDDQLSPLIVPVALLKRQANRHD
jgi:hypothetical protein